MKKTILATLLLSTLAFLSHAQTINEIVGSRGAVQPLVTNSPMAVTDIESIRASLLRKFPQNPPPTSIAATTVPGIYELLLGDQIAYVDSTATYFFFGAQFVDLAAQRNLTQERMGMLLKIDAKTLNVKDAIKRVQGTGEHTLYLFTDPFCPFCKKAEEELPKVKNVTIYTFMMPRPDAKQVAESIWCATDPAQAWVSYMTAQKEPTVKTCDNPIQRNSELASQKLNVSGTPTLFRPDGTRLAGYTSAEQIEKFMTGGPTQ